MYASPSTGRSLVPLLRSAPRAEALFQDRVRFTESEFTPRELNMESITADGLAEAALFYNVHPSTDRIEFRRERVAEVHMNRRYAAFGPNELLAAVPGIGGSAFELFAVRVDRSEARRMTHVPAQDAELTRLRNALESKLGITLTAAAPPAAH